MSDVHATTRAPNAINNSIIGQNARSCRPIAALYVQGNGCYAGLPGVDPWDINRDARRYAGPWPVVAHPPCARWGRFAHGGPSAPGSRIPGDDDGCFAAALGAVRQFGGVLEHPADSLAWAVHGLFHPPRAGGWVAADWDGGWTCCVFQGHYGHPCPKATWLYVVGTALPSLIWGPARHQVDRASAGKRRLAIRKGVYSTLTHRERAATPSPFRDLLLSMARSAPVDHAEVCDA